MSRLPPVLEAYLLDRALEQGHAAFVELDGTRRIRRAGGALSRYGLPTLEAGDELGLRAPFLRDLLPRERSSTFLPSVHMPAGPIADVHVVASDAGMLVLLLDVSEAAGRQQAMQQRVHELELEHERGASLDAIVACLDAVVLQRDPDGALHLAGSAPGWLGLLDVDGATALLAGDRLRDPAALGPFLENFLVDAERCWESGKPGTLRSGVWIETLRDGTERPFDALAVRTPRGGQALVVELADDAYQRRSEILQAARSASLEQERLLQEIEKKEVLLHCIVHDLNGPLSTIVGSLSMLKNGALPEDTSRELVELGLGQADRQAAMIRQVLEVFSAEIQSMETYHLDAETAPDAAACIRRILDAHAPAFLNKQVTLRAEPPDLGAEPVAVVGRTDRLERVVMNLLENALRHSPSGSTVVVGVARVPEGVRITVDDEGPGVPPELADTLFEKFQRDAGRGGVAGLGLYFCRYTVEQWGGSIGFLPREPKGTRFWFVLPSPSLARADD